MKTLVTTTSLMQPIAHFSHAARVGGLVHVGAAAGTDAARRLAGSAPGRPDLAAQLERMLANFDTVLSLVGAARAHVVEFRAWVADTRDLAACARAVDAWLGDAGAARVVGASFGFPLPHASVEADLVAAIAPHAAPRHLHAGPGADAATGLAAVQAASALDTLERLLESHGLRPADLVHLRISLADVRAHGEVAAVLARRLAHAPPARAFVVAPLADPRALLHLDAVALPGGGRPVEPAGHGAGGVPPAVLAGEHLYLGGQNGVGDDGAPVGDVEAQTRAAWRRIEALVDAAGFERDSVVRTTNVLTDWRDYAGFNAGYGAHVRRPYPPRTTVLGGLVEPGARVQVEAIAHRDGARATVLDTPGAPDPAVASGTPAAPADPGARDSR